jgi:hypothetical protein
MDNINGEINSNANVNSRISRLAPEFNAGRIKNDNIEKIRNDELTSNVEKDNLETKSS